MKNARSLHQLKQQMLILKIKLPVRLFIKTDFMLLPRI